MRDWDDVIEAQGRRVFGLDVLSVTIGSPEYVVFPALVPNRVAAKLQLIQSFHRFTS